MKTGQLSKFHELKIIARGDKIARRYFCTKGLFCTQPLLHEQTILHGNNFVRVNFFFVFFNFFFIYFNCYPLPSVGNFFFSFLLSYDVVYFFCLLSCKTVTRAKFSSCSFVPSYNFDPIPKPIKLEIFQLFFISHSLKVLQICVFFFSNLQALISDIIYVVCNITHFKVFCNFYFY